MFSPDQYELLDFGLGEKLECFAGVPVRRATPAAIGAKSNANKWPQQCLKFSRNSDGDKWSQSVSLPDPWLARHQGICFQLKPTPFGHLGIFAEQAMNWSWLCDVPGDLTGLKAINLFAYTGGTTMALAAKGAQVTHVDSSKTVVNWARSNASLSGLGTAPIRWIVEDARKYVAREIKRGNQYDIVVADPPSFGHGTRNEIWKLERDLKPLLESLALLTQNRCALILISCHTPDFDSSRLAEMVSACFGLAKGSGTPMVMRLTSRDGRELPSGCCFRWSA